MSSSCCNVPRVVGPDLGAVAVLQRSDDAPAIRVVLWIGRGHQEDVQRQNDAVPFYLDIALLHEVEKADLNSLGQVWELINGKYSPVGAGYETVVNRQLIGEAASLGDPDGVYLADQVGHRDVGGGQLLGIALLSGQPGDLHAVPVAGHPVLAVATDRAVRTVVELATRNRRDFLIQQ